MTNREDNFRLTRIADAIRQVGSRVNLIGVVTETGLLKPTKGTDYIVTLEIMDGSGLSMKLVVNFFYETMEKLPRVNLEGDIILLRNVTMKSYGEKLVNAVFNKWDSSFALFEGKIDASVVPYQSSTNYTLMEQDKNFIIGFRKRMIDYPIAKVSYDFKSLSEIKEGDYNLLCKILHIHEVKNDEWIIFVWDGTDTPPVQLMIELDDELENPIPLHVETFSLPKDVLCSFPSVGTVLRITSRQCDKFGTKFLKSGTWIKFVNLKCVTRSGLWHAELMHYTRLCYLPEDNGVVLQHQRLHEERLSGKLTWMSLTGFAWHSDLTETELSHMPCVSLMHVLTNPQAEAKFRCVVRVVAMLPWEVDDFRISDDGNFRIRFTLEDPTARIHAYLYGDDGVTFFEDPDSVVSMTMKRNKLLGMSETDGEVNDVGRNPPWVECGIESYCTDKNERWKSRTYWIYNTRLVG